MPPTRESVAAFERLVRFFCLMALLGAALLVVAIAVGFLTEGATRAGLLGALCGTGGLMLFIGIREWRKGRRMAAQLRRRVQST